jgi:hypothetical protein
LGNVVKMGLDYNYLLYFKRECLWDALQGVAKISELDNHPPTTIHFPDHDLVLPIRSGFRQEHDQPHDKAEYNFDASLKFEVDDSIWDYVCSRMNNLNLLEAPDDSVNQVAIGYIYLTVYADLSQHWAFMKPTDLVLFQFGTTGTHMSRLFNESDSIRKTFTKLLEKHRGVCGIFDRENDGGEVFWINGLRVREYIDNVYMHPDAIEETIKRTWGRGKDNDY